MAKETQREMDRALWTAARKGILGEVQALKGKGADPSWFNPWEPPGRGTQFTALHVAADGGHIDVVKYLVNTCKVDFTLKCGEGLTPCLCPSHGR